MQKERIIGYDVLKTIAVYSLVVYHFGRVNFGEFNEDGIYSPNVVKVLFEFLACCVPVFFIINGALVGDRKVGWWKVLKYLILSTFYPLFFYAFVYPSVGFESCPLQDMTLIEVLSYKKEYWFLATLAMLYVVNFIARKIKAERIMASILLITPFLTNFIFSILIYINPGFVMPFWGHWGVFTLYSYVYFFFGNEYKLSICDKRTYMLALCMFFIGWGILVFDVVSFSNYYKEIYDGVNASFPTLGAAFLSCSMFLLIKDCKIKSVYLRKYVCFIGRNTMGVYVLHMFFILFLRKYFVLHAINPMFVILLSALIVNVTALISEISSRTPLRSILK